ncbi:alanine dehydrogenase [Sanyastnella coralliicola]|uniref:alanine dehydrogenase n=1 Tax=Sanyastnella coralliicola TaxID=3069118 RepID=UPI0027B97266|nr:alanine dehydrogenase [Longitalea sp. SCSIO 12813]
MDSKKDAIRALAQEAALLPQEEMLEVGKRHQRLTIGIPKETSFQEKRVALVPEAVAMLTAHGHEVIVETNAGRDASFQDKDYSEAGAKIVYDTKEVFQSNIILKVAPPSLEEVKMMPGKQTLLSALQLTVQPVDSLKMLISKKITAIAWDYVRDETGIFPVVRSMGEIAGNTSVLIAAEHLSNVNQGQGLMFGGISGVRPTEVVILGAGTVGEFAARAAIGLGASVKLFDNSMYKLRRIQNDLGQRLWTSTIQPSVLEEALSKADVAIGALRAPFGRTPCVVTENMVSQMKYGSVIVDISIDQGGCFETSRVTNHDTPTFKEYGVVHYCVPNVASRVSRTASSALSNIFAPILVNVGSDGGWTSAIKRHPGLRDGVYLFNGSLVNEIIGEAFNLPYKRLDLLLAAL